MARYVVLEFAKNADADEFIQQINEQTAQGMLRRIVGVFVKPGRVCHCYKWERTNSGDKNEKVGIQRGGKFGWWVCTQCNRPRRAGHDLVNQILPSETYPELLSAEDAEFEFTVSTLGVGGIYLQNIDRPKKLRKVRKLWPAASSS
jgi:hypothetical protein